MARVIDADALAALVGVRRDPERATADGRRIPCFPQPARAAGACAKFPLLTSSSPLIHYLRTADRF